MLKDRSFTQSALFNILKQKRANDDKVVQSQDALDINTCLSNIGDFLRAATHMKTRKDHKLHLLEIDESFLNLLKQLVNDGGNSTTDKRKLYVGLILTSVTLDYDIVNVCPHFEYFNKSIA